MEVDVSEFEFLTTLRNFIIFLLKYIPLVL